jgi:hypothetical protein
MFRLPCGLQAAKRLAIKRRSSSLDLLTLALIFGAALYEDPAGRLAVVMGVADVLASGVAARPVFY